MKEGKSRGERNRKDEEEEKDNLRTKEKNEGNMCRRHTCLSACILTDSFLTFTFQVQRWHSYQDRLTLTALYVNLSQRLGDGHLRRSTEYNRQSNSSSSSSLRQQRLNCLTAASCHQQNPAPVPFIVSSIINAEWKAAAEQACSCRQSPHTMEIMSWQWGHVYFNCREMGSVSSSSNS